MDISSGCMMSSVLDIAEAPIGYIYLELRGGNQAIYISCEKHHYI